MELLDVYDDNGNVTGKVIERGNKSLNKGEHIAVGVIFIENDNGEYLIQKTSKEKGGYYSSTGGHIDHGEIPNETIKREVLEELGIDISNDKVEEYGFINNGMALMFLYYLKKNIDIKDIVVQTEEVDYAEYMDIDKINGLIDSGEMLKSHGMLFRELLKRKNN